MSFRVLTDVLVEMRDGVFLSTDVWIPDGPPAPALLARLPYGKNLLPVSEVTYATMPNLFRLLEAGYAVVWQDCRGTGRSEGSFVPMSNEASDGADTVDWISRQEWCDGNVGMFGHSYLGFAQWAVARTSPTALKAIAPSITSPVARDFWFSAGGTFSWRTLWFWSQFMAIAETAGPRDAGMNAGEAAARAATALASEEEQLSRLPLIDQTDLQSLWPWWSDYLASLDTGEGTLMEAEDPADGVEVPAFILGGWFDPFVSATVRSFVSRQQSESAGSRKRSQMIIGPWDHMFFTGEYMDRNFGPEASLDAIDMTSRYVTFFDRTVREMEDDTATSPILLFVMGLDRWREEREWPIPDTRYTDYYLASTLGAKTRFGDGTLTAIEAIDPSSDSFIYDPASPVPSRGGRMLTPASLNLVGPVDQSLVEEREDVLCYTTDRLTHPIEVTGFATAVLHVTSTATDTDFTAKLVDVFPDGRAVYLTDGITRARFREGLNSPRLLTPGEATEITIDMGVTSNVFLAGHCIRVEISSSNFPRYDRNLNTGGSISRGTEHVVATNTVLTGSRTPSRIVLPVVERGEVGPAE